MPLPFARCTLSHGGLEGPQLSHSLQALDSLNRFHKVIRIRISDGCLMVNGLQKDWIFLQVLRWPIEEVF